MIRITVLAAVCASTLLTARRAECCSPVPLTGPIAPTSSRQPEVRLSAAPGHVWWLHRTDDVAPPADGIVILHDGIDIVGEASVVVVGPRSIGLRVPLDFDPGRVVVDDLTGTELAVAAPVETTPLEITSASATVEPSSFTVGGCDQILGIAPFQRQKEITAVRVVLQRNRLIAENDVLLNAWMVPRDEEFPDDEAPRAVELSTIGQFLPEQSDAATILHFTILDPGEWKLRLEIVDANTGSILRDVELDADGPPADEGGCNATTAQPRRSSITSALCIAVLGLVATMRRRTPIIPRRPV